MYCIIMAGGSGTRFWPRSRDKKSKQFLRLQGNQSLIQSTLKRFHTFIPWDQMFIVSKSSQKEELLQHIFKVPQENILYEPIGKNTAPCIGLAALAVEQKDKDGVIIVSPADHLIKNRIRFRDTIRTAIELAKNYNSLVTVGIQPTRPSTGYGYIQVDKSLPSGKDSQTYTVKTFAEKPNLATAERFIESGDFYWNSGIFVFRVSVFLKSVAKYLPELYDSLKEIRKVRSKPNYEEILQRVYQQIRSISIDYGIMEKASNVLMVKGNFTWDDLGSWEQIYDLSTKDKEGNAVTGDALILDTSNSYIYSSQGVVAVVGLDNVIVVQDGSRTLVCSRDKVEDVRHIVEKLKRGKFKKYA